MLCIIYHLACSLAYIKALLYVWCGAQCRQRAFSVNISPAYTIFSGDPELANYPLESWLVTGQEFCMALCHSWCQPWKSCSGPDSSADQLPREGTDRHPFIGLFSRTTWV